VIEQHYKTEELAGRLALHPETLRRAAARGEVCPIRMGRDLLWPESEVERWLQTKRVDNGVVVRLSRSSTIRRTA
jgi:excisionase family DNA binding protein